jgi:hypothetical protein
MKLIHGQAAYGSRPEHDVAVGTLNTLRELEAIASLVREDGQRLAARVPIAVACWLASARLRPSAAGAIA